MHKATFFDGFAIVLLVQAAFVIAIAVFGAILFIAGPFWLFVSLIAAGWFARRTLIRRMVCYA